MILIDRTQIETWGRQFDAKGNFPRLIAKLIIETTPKSTFLRIPSGSAVNIGGWDGIVQCEENTAYVPAGLSLWEIGTNGDQSKANKDYNKRTADSLGFDKKDASYVFVTTNIWKTKDDWEEEKKQEGIWKDIKVYDCIDIAAWLENAQISCRWFSILTKDHPFDGIYTADEYWKMLSIGPKGQLPPKIVTAGRNQESKILFDFLMGKPSLIAIKGSTKEEAIAFIIASAMLFDFHENELFFSRSVVVSEEQKFHGLRINKNSINLIANLDDIARLYVAAHVNGHHVLVPLGPDDPFDSKDIIELPRIGREGQVEALIEMGLSDEEANRYSREAGRDYTILKGLLGFIQDERKWKDLGNVHEMVPALLIGRWDESIEGDRNIIERLSGYSYPDYSEKLIKWLEIGASPLIKIGSTWRLTSPLNAWINLAKYLSATDFENLKSCFQEVMKEINPVFELEPDQRYMAALKGKVSAYSTWCREGLTQSMILVGLHGDKLSFQHSFSPQSWVDNIIKELLYNAPGVLWKSLNHEMPLISEASPNSFFESAYHSLSLDDKPIMDMFIEEDNYISPQSHHTGLLWALEALAWTVEHVYDASLLLAKFATLDPGGRLINRPLNSLKEIFKPWHYQTLASFDERMEILKQIIKREPQKGWELLCSMIPKGPESAFPTHKFKWRLFERSFDNQYLWSEIFTTHSKVLELLIEHFDYSEKKLIDLLQKSESKHIQPIDQERILLFIESCLDKIHIKDNSAWHDLRETLSQHRSHQTAHWALSKDILKRYEAIYNRLEPSDIVERVIWMFNKQFPSFPEGIDKKDLSYEDQEKFLLGRRCEGLKLIYQEFGFIKIKELVKSIKETWILGDTLAYFIDTEKEILSLCEYLTSDDISFMTFIQGFIYRKSRLNGIDWVFELYGKLKRNGYSDISLARIFYRVEQYKEVWKFIDNISPESQNSYWKKIQPHFWHLSKDELIYGIDKLMDVKRFISAVDVASHMPENLPTKKLVEILENVGTKRSEEEGRLDSYDVTRIIEELKNREDVNKSVLLRIEWMYLPLLTSYGSDHSPKLLHQELANNPEFFIEILSWVYKSEKENEAIEDNQDEARQNRSKNAFELLYSWKQIPGMDESGIINEDILFDWVNKARANAEQLGRLNSADVHIGNILAEYPENKEPWPPKEICKVIEVINTDSLKSGFSTSTYNKRGSSVRGPFDGGEIERGHARYFNAQAKAIKYEFPETAKILTRLAKGYENDAKRMDDMAEREELDC